MSLPLDEVWLEGSRLPRPAPASEELSGLDFLQMRFTGTWRMAGTLTLRIDAMTQGTGADQDVWSYRVSYQHTMDGQVVTPSARTQLARPATPSRWRTAGTTARA